MELICLFGERKYRTGNNILKEVSLNLSPSSILKMEIPSSNIVVCNMTLSKSTIWEYTACSKRSEDQRLIGVTY